ncbi:MAG: 4a-hydroxytetrahydrobiopterin dehydratase [Desulfuromonas sp.]|nr:4a-hydroxytetrahydrobiopterin dehydratase [Desulfuromonas sp.]
MADTVCDLANRHCKPCEGGMPAMERTSAEKLLATLPGWELQDNAIARRFEFKNFYQTIAFVNAVAWIANSENHHPDLEVSYKACRVRYMTHAVGGLSENDFICAARINALLPE